MKIPKTVVEVDKRETPNEGEHIKMVRNRLRLISSRHEETLEKLTRVERLTPGKKGRQATALKTTAENMEDASNKNIKSHERVQQAQKSRVVYAEDAKRTTKHGSVTKKPAASGKR